VGAGSIGSRHLRNLRALGLRRLAVCDPDPARLAAAVDGPGAAGFAEARAALDAFAPDVVLVCTPPPSHVELALAALEGGAHVFVEKPLADVLDGVDALVERARRAGRVAQVGYNLRFHPGVCALKELVDAGAVGRVLWLRSEVGQWLPDWRPGQDYRRSYSARRALGGGILLDASHELDYVLWLLGEPAEVACMAGRVSDLEMDVEDCATVLLRFPGGAQADVHVDCVQRGYARTCRVAGTEGTLAWDYLVPEVRLYRAATGAWETRRYTFEPNDMYVAELRHFLDCAARGTAPRVGLADGRRALALALAARAAARSGRTERGP